MSEEPLSERPLTDCPNCGGEIDLTFSDAGSTITCVVCGSVLNVIGLDPPEVEAGEGE
jgi:lysine biosynthesis protein LysW